MRTLRAVLVVLAVGFMFENVALADDPFAVREDAIVESGSFGIGFGHAGWISGVSGKLLLGETQALQGVVGWGRWQTALGVALDYTIELGSLADVDIFRLNYYAGVGGVLGLGDWGAFGMGINAVVGLSFRLRALPLELSGEFRPTFLVGNWASADIFPFRFWGGGAIRWYF